MNKKNSHDRNNAPVSIGINLDFLLWKCSLQLTKTWQALKVQRAPFILSILTYLSLTIKKTHTHKCGVVAM